MACFSPSVPRHFRVLWVQHQGKLTHSEQDFYEADYFFCAGTDDVWWKRLTAKQLIVYHPAWICACISNAFLMPASSYVLDHLFDPRAIVHEDAFFETSFKQTLRNFDPSPSSSPKSFTQHNWSPGSCDTTDQHPTKRQRLNHNTNYAEEQEIGLSLTLVHEDEEDEMNSSESGAPGYSVSSFSIPQDYRHSTCSSRSRVVYSSKIHTPFHTNAFSRRELAPQNPLTAIARHHPGSATLLPELQDERFLDEAGNESREDYSENRTYLDPPQRQDENQVNGDAAIPGRGRTQLVEPKLASKANSKKKEKSYFEANVIRIRKPEQSQKEVPSSGSASEVASGSRSSRLDLVTLDTKLEEIQCSQQIDTYRSFWKDLHRKTQTQNPSSNGSYPLSLSVPIPISKDTLILPLRDLLRAPRAQGVTLFEPGTVHEGKTFQSRRVDIDVDVESVDYSGVSAAYEYEGIRHHATSEESAEGSVRGGNLGSSPVSVRRRREIVEPLGPGSRSGRRVARR